MPIATISTGVVFTRRPVPDTYDKGFFVTEFQNAERAIQPFVTRKLDVNTTQLVNDRTVNFACTGNRSYTLLASTLAKIFPVTVKNDASSGAFTVTIIGTVDGGAAPVLVAGHALTIQPDADGSQFIILGSYP